MLKSEALAIIGGLSKPSKMPGPSYSTSAFDCQTGSKLRDVAGSVCSKCYARKGNYVWPGVKEAHARRLATIVNALADDVARAKWVQAMVTLLAGVPHFRWHDSGDVQSVEHFGLIADVARATPDTMHWLPTKEPRYVKRYAGTIPDNLIVRVSAPMIDGPAPQGFAHTSTVHKAAPALAGSHVCPAPSQGGKCGDCRACWSRDVANVSYAAH
jgi:hypothetical protein